MVRYLIPLNLVLILSIGNFVPLPFDDLFTTLVKGTILFLTTTLILLYSNQLKLSIGILSYFLIITIFYLVSSFSARDIVYATEKYLSVSLCVISSIALIKIHSKRFSSNQLAKIIVTFGFFILCLTIVYKLRFGFWDRQVRFFINGPIIFGWMMGFYCLLSIHLSRFSRNKIYLLLPIFFAIAILWSESKGPFLALSIALFFYSIYGVKRYIQLSLYFLILILYIFQGSFLRYLESALNDTRFGGIVRLTSGSVSNQDVGSITIRQNMLVEGLDLFIQNPFMGIGLGNYQFYTDYNFFYPHNSHLEIFMECGLFIGLCYLIFVFMGFIKASKLIRTLMIFFIICGSFSGDISYLRFLFTLCIISYASRLKLIKSA